MKENEIIQKDGVVYFRLYTKCPVCLERDVPVDSDVWYHYDDNCGGHIYIGDNAHLYCEECGQEQELRKCGWLCPQHFLNKTECMVSFNNHGGKIAFSKMIPKIIPEGEPGLVWLNKYINSLLRQI